MVFLTLGALLATVAVVYLVQEAPRGASRSCQPITSTFQSVPYTSGAKFGRTYSYCMYDHCGIAQAQVDGASWRSVDGSAYQASPDYSGLSPGGSSRKPLGNPYDRGTMVVTSASRAVYTASNGAKVVFRPVQSGDAPLGLCS